MKIKKVKPPVSDNRSRYMKRLIMMMVTVLGMSCTMNVYNTPPKEVWVSEESLGLLEEHTGDVAYLRIGSSEYLCKLVSSDKDQITVMDKKNIVKIPTASVSYVRLAKSAGHSTPAMVAGGLLGGVSGIAAGTALSKETKNYQSGGNQLKYQLAAGALGAGLGVLLGNWFHDPEDGFEVNPEAKVVKLHEKMPTVVPALELQRYGLFNDIRLEGGEQLLSVEVIQYGDKGYLLSYEVHDGASNNRRFEMTDIRYIDREKHKVHGYSGPSAGEAKPVNLPFQNENQ